MGFIRSILLIGVSILLFLSLFIGNIFLTLSWSLEYETVKPQMISLVEDLANNEGLFESVNKNFYSMTTYCQNNSEYVFAQEGYTFVIPCENILLGPEEVIKYSIANLVMQMYYEEYDCNFWDCVKSTDKPFVLVSEKAKDYWKSKFYFVLMITIGLIILIFLLAEQKSNFTIILGGLIIFSSLPFMKINSLLALISPESIMNFLPIFFIRSYNVFLIMFIIGLGILILGIGLKFVSIGLNLTNFFSKIQEVDSTSLKKGDSEIPKVENMTKEEITKIIKEEVNKKCANNVNKTRYMNLQISESFAKVVLLNILTKKFFILIENLI